MNPNPSWLYYPVVPKASWSFCFLYCLNWSGCHCLRPFRGCRSPGTKLLFQPRGFSNKPFLSAFFSFLFLLSNQRDLRTLKSVAYYVADTIDSRFNLQLEGKRES